MRRPSEESIRTEFCDGPILEDNAPHAPSSVQEVQGGTVDKMVIGDRGELIERIKRGESPTWVPSRTVSKEHFSLLLSSLPFNST